MIGWRRECHTRLLRNLNHHQPRCHRHAFGTRSQSTASLASHLEGSQAHVTGRKPILSEAQLLESTTARKPKKWLASHLQGSQAHVTARKPICSKTQPLENTMARKPNPWLASPPTRKHSRSKTHWLVSRKPSSSRVATHQSSPAQPSNAQNHRNQQKKLPVSPLYSVYLPPPAEQASKPHPSIPFNIRYTQACSRLFSINKDVVVLGIPVCILPLPLTSRPAPESSQCHTAFRFPSSFSGLLFPGSQALSLASSFPVPELFPDSWLLPVPGSFPVLSSFGPLVRLASCGLRRAARRRKVEGGGTVREGDWRAGAAYDGRRGGGGRREDEGGWWSRMAIEGAAYGTTGASSVWDCNGSVRCSSTKVLVRRVQDDGQTAFANAGFVTRFIRSGILVFHHWNRSRWCFKLGVQKRRTDL
jgi:hypothetical protein